MTASAVRLKMLFLAAVTTIAGALVPRSALGAQDASLKGVVFSDSGRVPIANAEVLLSNLDRSVRTDKDGRFSFAGVKSGKHKLIVRLVGYEPVSTNLQFDGTTTVETEVILRRTGTQLATVNVSASPVTSAREKMFNENRKSPGKFLTKEVFEQGNGRPLIDLVTRKITGLTVMNLGGQSVLTSTRSNQNGRNCRLDIVVDGADMTRLGLFDLNTLNSLNVIGVEYYTAAQTPARYNQINSNAKCGTIVVWTKD